MTKSTDRKDKQPNALKWTVENVQPHLDAIAKDINEGGSLFLSSALGKRGLYKDIWAYWKRRFEAEEDLIEAMLCIETVLEGKLVEGALKKEFSPLIAMLLLRNNHGWSSKSSSEEDKPKEAAKSRAEERESRKPVTAEDIERGGPSVVVTLAHDVVDLIFPDRTRNGVYRRLGNNALESPHIYMAELKRKEEQARMAS